MRVLNYVQYTSPKGFLGSDDNEHLHKPTMQGHYHNNIIMPCYNRRKVPSTLALINKASDCPLSHPASLEPPSHLPWSS